MIKPKIKHWFGTNKTVSRVNDIDLFLGEGIMRSTYSYQTSQKIIKYLKDNHDIYELLKHAANIFLDSGGFQILKQNIKIIEWNKTNPEKQKPLIKCELLDVVNFYLLCGFRRKKGYGLVLDECPYPNEDPKDRMLKIIKTNNNLTEMRMLGEDIFFNIVHIMQGYTEKELAKSLEPLQHNDEEMIAVGSCYPLVFKYGKGFLIPKFINLINLRYRYPEKSQVSLMSQYLRLLNTETICLSFSKKRNFFNRLFVLK